MDKWNLLLKLAETASNDKCTTHLRITTHIPSAYNDTRQIQNESCPNEWIPLNSRSVAAHIWNVIREWSHSAELLLTSSDSKKFWLQKTWSLWKTFQMWLYWKSETESNGGWLINWKLWLTLVSYCGYVSHQNCFMLNVNSDVIDIFF